MQATREAAPQDTQIRAMMLLGDSACCHDVAAALFSEPGREALADAFGLAAGLTTPDDLAGALIEATRPPARLADRSRPGSSRDILHAVIRAMASEGAAWGDFCACEAVLSAMLRDFEPTAVMARFREGEIAIADIAAVLPGRRRERRAAAILGWAERLQRFPDYAGFLQRLAAGLAVRARLSWGDEVGDGDIALLVAAAISRPTRKTRLLVTELGLPASHLKAPGMGMTTSVDFLWQLGWPVFRPTAFAFSEMQATCPSLLESCRERAAAFLDIVGSRDRDVCRAIACSLAGSRLSHGAMIPEVVAASALVPKG